MNVEIWKQNEIMLSGIIKFDVMRGIDGVMRNYIEIINIKIE